VNQREKILNHRQMGSPIAIPEWDCGEVYIRIVPADEMERWAESCGDDNVRGKFAALTLCNAAGIRIFEDADAAKLGKQPFAILERIWQQGAPLNGLDTNSAKNS